MVSSTQGVLRWAATRTIGLAWALRELHALWRVRATRRGGRAIHAAD